MEEAYDSFENPSKYLVLVAAVRLLVRSNARSTDKAKKVLNFPILGEESFYNIKIYTKLIQAIIDEKAQKFINEIIQEEKLASMYYDDSMVAYFEEIINCQDNMQNLLITIEEQLLGMAYAESGGDCKNHKRQVINYLHKNKILDEIIVYKDKGIVINKSMLFLDTVAAMSVRDVETMARLAFHL